MKVYIVTSGCYSDYSICNVFTDKAKAEKYAKGIYDVNEIEEWDTEDRDCKLYTSIRLNVKFNKKGVPIESLGYGRPKTYNFSIDIVNSLDGCPDYYESTCYYSNFHDHQLMLNRVIKKELSVDEIEKYKEKYKKVALDLMAKIKSLIEIECWNVKMVNEWLKDKNNIKGD